MRTMARCDSEKAIFANSSRSNRRIEATEESLARVKKIQDLQNYIASSGVFHDHHPPPWTI